MSYFPRLQSKQIIIRKVKVIIILLLYAATLALFIVRTEIVAGSRIVIDTGTKNGSNACTYAHACAYRHNNNSRTGRIDINSISFSMYSFEIGSIEVKVDNSNPSTSYASASKSETRHSSRLSSISSSSSISDYKHDAETVINANNSNSMNNATAME